MFAKIDLPDATAADWSEQGPIPVFSGLSLVFCRCVVQTGPSFIYKNQARLIHYIHWCNLLAMESLQLGLRARASY